MLTLCVTNKNRTALFKRSVAALAKASKLIRFSLVVADWHSTDCPVLSWLPDACYDAGIPLTVVCMPEGPFSRGRGLNAAAAAADSKKLFFTDTDMLIDTSILSAAEHNIACGKAYFPICWSYGDAEHTKGRYRMGGKGIVALPRSVFLAADRWDEFTTWGYEDQRFYDRVAKIAKIERPMELALKHQWHPTIILKGIPK